MGLDYKNIFLIIIALCNFLLGVIVFWHGRDKKSKVNLYYFLISLSVTLWALGMIMWRGSLEHDTKLLWCRWLYVFATFIPTSFVWFCYRFPDHEIRFTTLSKVILLGSNILLAISSLIPEGIIADVFIVPNAEDQIIFGIPYFLYNIYITVIFIWGFWILYKKHKQATGLVKAQIRYVFFGTLISSTLGMITNLILPTFGYFQLNWLGQGLTIIMVGFIGYAIVTHRLMDIKFVLRRSFVYLSSLVTLILPIIAIEYLVVRFFYQLDDVITVVLIIIAVLIFSPLKHYYYRVANKYFFSSLYDSRQVIAEMSDKLRSSLEVHKISSAISETLVDAFHVKAAGILIYDQDSDQYSAIYNHNFKIGEQKTFANNKILFGLFAGQNKTLVVEEIDKSSFAQKTQAIREFLAGLGVEILTPLNIEKKHIGLIVLGPKESGDMYNDEDLKVLEIVGAQGAVALQNALLYEESLAFGRRLKIEVDRATKDLRSANQRLRQLDQAKTEFISVASHQLRTPLSGIKGYLSMILDGDFGRVVPKQHKIIQELYDNNERLIRLVNVFLNISRIESGRLKIEKKKTDLLGLIQTAITQIQNSAKNKGLKLGFIKPASKIPLLEIDQDKIMDVVLNLIDNAIKYTPTGSIDVLVKREKDKVRVEVKDTGIGIDQEQLDKLFGKFVRGIDASKLSTTGSGLGLFIAKKIIELHGGTIKGESSGEGQGSTFSFELPV